MDTEREIAEVFSLAEHLYDEMKHRGWTTLDVAKRIKTGATLEHDLLAFDLLMSIHDDGIILDDNFCEGIARAFDVSPEYIRNIDNCWRKWPDKRSEFIPPEEIFTETSIRGLWPAT